MVAIPLLALAAAYASERFIRSHAAAPVSPRLATAAVAVLSILSAFRAVTATAEGDSVRAAVLGAAAVLWALVPLARRSGRSRTQVPVDGLSRRETADALPDPHHHER